MEAKYNSIEELITTVLADIRQKGYSSVQPFSIGKVEARMMLFAQTATRVKDPAEFTLPKYRKI